MEVFLALLIPTLTYCLFDATSANIVPACERRQYMVVLNLHQNDARRDSAPGDRIRATSTQACLGFLRRSYCAVSEPATLVNARPLIAAHLWMCHTLSYTSEPTGHTSTPHPSRPDQRGNGLASNSGMLEAADGHGLRLHHRLPTRPEPDSASGLCKPCAPATGCRFPTTG